MKQKLFITALLLTSLIGFNASAQDNDGAPKREKKEHVRGDRHNAPHFNPFEGITLTEDQKAQFKALREESKARFEERKQSQQCKADSAKCNKDGKCCKKDGKAGHRDAVKGNRGNRPNKNMRAGYIKKVKEILTPEQYVVFLENIATQPQPAFGPRQQRHDGKGPRHDKGAKQGCPQCDKK